MDVKLRKVLLTTLSALSVAAISGAAFAQTAPSITAGGVASNILDGAAPGSISVAGITVYGTIDVGGFYQNRSSPQAGSNYIGAPYLPSAGSVNPSYLNRSQFNYQNNAMSQSRLGIKGEQSIGALTGLEDLRDWRLGFNAQIDFDPLYGDIADICKAMVHNNGLTLSKSSADSFVFGADGSRCGQLFGGEVYASLKNNVLGELRFGRNNTLLLDSLSAYDAQAGSYAFSLFAFSGTNGGGGGATEDARWNNSLKYTNTIGPVRFGAAYRFEGGGQGGDAWGVQAGVDLPGALKGLSFDADYSHESAAITSGSLSSVNCTALLGAAGAGQCDNTNTLAGTVLQAEAWAVMAKYKFDAASMLKGATIMGGYEWYERTNTGDRLANLNTIGGYSLVNVAGTSSTPNYFKYQTPQDFDVYWLGGKYLVTPKLTAAAAWYHIDQHSYLAGSNTSISTFTTATSKCTVSGKVGVAYGSTCGGQLNEYSVSLDYQLTQRLDLYAGVQWVDLNKGIASGTFVTNDYTLASGVRFRF